MCVLLITRTFDVKSVSHSGKFVNGVSSEACNCCPPLLVSTIRQGIGSSSKSPPISYPKPVLLANRRTTTQDLAATLQWPMYPASLP